jgi:hypothetical protein
MHQVLGESPTTRTRTRTREKSQPLYYVTIQDKDKFKISIEYLHPMQRKVCKSDSGKSSRGIIQSREG